MSALNDTALLLGSLLATSGAALQFARANISRPRSCSCTGAGWGSLQTPSEELRLEFTLPTGQSFRWRRTTKEEFTGVVGQRVVVLRQEANDVLYRVSARGAGASEADDHAVLHDYFNLGTSLNQLSPCWARCDPRFKAISPYFPGARMLRQDPVECLFQFICSSNNHISRIHGMVERLCAAYGTRLNCASHDKGEEDGAVWYAFPTLQQLSQATEEELRASGFGYRAKFIVGSVRELLAKPEGGEAWLMKLRQASAEDAVAALMGLPGCGPKVAACVALFSLDKHEIVPVDTHVWQIATRHYTPHLKGKSLTKKVYAAVAEAFVKRFGAYAGWAHNTLFISELASMREHLPAHLQPGGRAAPAKKALGADDEDFAAGTSGKRRRTVRKFVETQLESSSDMDSSAEGEGQLENVPAKRRRTGHRVVKQEPEDTGVEASAGAADAAVITPGRRRKSAAKAVKEEPDIASSRWQAGTWEAVSRAGRRRLKAVKQEQQDECTSTEWRASQCPPVAGGVVQLQAGTINGLVSDTTAGGHKKDSKAEPAPPETPAPAAVERRSGRRPAKPIVEPHVVTVASQSTPQIKEMDEPLPGSHVALAVAAAADLGSGALPGGQEDDLHACCAVDAARHQRPDSDGGKHSLGGVEQAALGHGPAEQGYPKAPHKRRRDPSDVMHNGNSLDREPFVVLPVGHQLLA